MNVVGTFALTLLAIMATVVHFSVLFHKADPQVQLKLNSIDKLYVIFGPLLERWLRGGGRIEIIDDAILLADIRNLVVVSFIRWTAGHENKPS